ncbi:MAG: glycoside hydrolase family 127 protein [Bacteroidales bacterium]|nr:glycoside hydrolase family 127 protein [Bacteroidales bacterium]
MKSLFLLRLVVGVLLLFHLHSATAQLRHPLSFVAPENILMVNPSRENVVQRALSIDPTLVPTHCTLTRQESSHYKKLYRKKAMPQSLDALARLLLVSGDARYAHAIDQYKQSLRDSLDRDSTLRSVAAALLHTVGMTAATDERGLYVNLLDDCMIIAKTPHFAVTVDQIAELEGHKYRISGLSSQGNTPLVLRLRLPHPTRSVTFYMNGRRLLSPHYERGYLVVERAWRNGDELFYRYE